jgi:hypothetical protein
LAQAGVVPTLATPSEAIRAFEEDLPKALNGRTLEEAGWRRLDDLTLLVPVHGIAADGVTEPYFVRLGFAYYPDWPPSVQFVNPDTLCYAKEDKCWLPKIDGCNEIQVHPAYEFENQVIQLVCSSVTLEFYIIKHNVEPTFVWDSNKQNFSAALNQIEWALRSNFYKGRQDVLPTRK